MTSRFPLLVRAHVCWMVPLAVASGASAQRSFDEIAAVYAERRVEAYDSAAEDFLARLQAGADARTQARLALVVPETLAGGGEVATWWRQQDPLPATDRNERLVEHLARVATAERAFPDDGPLGFDDRGEAFVRYGRPTIRRSIDVEADLFISRAVRDDPTIRRSDFPENEVWSYPALGPDIYFVFVRRRGRFKAGGVMDLVPPALLAGGLSRATDSRARLLGQVLRWIYKDLYTFSTEFSNRLVDIDAVLGADGRAFSGSTGLVLQGEVQRARQSDDLDQQARQSLAPRSQVQPASFGVTTRAAAFLDAPDGTVSVWVGWALDANRFAVTADSLAAVGLAPEQYIVESASVSYSPKYARQERSGALRVVPAGAGGIRPQWIWADGIVQGGHAAFQWTLTPATLQGEPIPPGAVAAQTLRIDSLGPALSSVSGLLTVDANAALLLDDIDRLGEFPPPQALGGMSAGAPLAVYYEVYGEVGTEYDIETRAIQVRQGQVFRSGSEQGGATGSRILLDDWRYPVLAVIDTAAMAGADELRVEVTVTAVGSGAFIRRELTVGLR